jgi:tetratricopeptide (TPR) repeat protein
MDKCVSDRGSSLAGPDLVGRDIGRREIPSPPQWRLRTLLWAAPLGWAPALIARPRRLLNVGLAIAIVSFGVWFLSWRVYGWHHHVEGKRSLQADHCRDALVHFQAVLQVWPEDPETLFLAARAARRAGDLDLAEHFLDQRKSTPALADSLSLERVLLRASRGEIDAVEHYCRSLLNLDHPDAELILEALAQGAMALLRFAQAAAYIEEWLALSPEQPQAFYMKARLHLQASHSQEALDLFRRTLKLDPKRDDAALFLAGIHLDLGQSLDALPYLEAVRRRRPDSADVQVKLARCLVLLGRHEEAIALLDEAIRRQPDLTAALLERGKLALRDDELERAENLLRRVCKRNPGNQVACYQLAQCLKRRGKTAEAHVVEQRHDQLEQDSKRIRDIVQTQLPDRPHDPILLAELGELYVKAGAPDEGIRWLKRTLQLDPNSGAAHRSLSGYYRTLGQTGLAEKHRARADAAGARGNDLK